MVKVEDIQSYGKEHLESVAASASNLQSGVQAIASAYGDYARPSSPTKAWSRSSPRPRTNFERVLPK